LNREKSFSLNESGELPVFLAIRMVIGGLRGNRRKHGQTGFEQTGYKTVGQIATALGQGAQQTQTTVLPAVIYNGGFSVTVGPG